MTLPESSTHLPRGSRSNSVHSVGEVTRDIRLLNLLRIRVVTQRPGANKMRICLPGIPVLKFTLHCCNNLLRAASDVMRLVGRVRDYEIVPGVLNKPPGSGWMDNSATARESHNTVCNSMATRSEPYRDFRLIHQGSQVWMLKQIIRGDHSSTKLLALATGQSVTSEKMCTYKQTGRRVQLDLARPQ